MFAVATTASSAADVFIVITSVLTILGGGSLFSIWRYAKKRGVRDAKIDQTVDVVLDPYTGHAELVAQSKSHGAALARIEGKMSANGLDSQHIGDIAARIERDVKQLSGEVREANTKLDRQIGANEEAHRSLRRKDEALGRLVRGIEEIVKT